MTDILTKGGDLETHAHAGRMPREMKEGETRAMFPGQGKPQLAIRPAGTAKRHGTASSSV